MPGGLPVINIPTSSATCAAVTALSVLYKDDGSTVGNFYPRKETDAVLVDTEIMAKQPPRFLAAGYIDALAKYIEIKNGKRSAEENNSAMDIITANVLAEHTYQNLTRLLPAALDSLERKTPTDDLDSFLFLSIPVTGIISGISKGYGQSAIGHEFYYCVRTLFTQEALQYLHGEIVGIGLLVQTYYNQTPELVAPLADMMKSLSMPLSLPEIGISGTVENFERIYNMILKSPFVGGDIDSRRRFREGLEIVMR